MFNAPNSRSPHQPLSKLTQFFEHVWWPPSVGRLPNKLVQNGAGKADQWRTLITVLFIGVFDAWQVDGAIPDINAPRSASNTKLATYQNQVQKLLRARLRERLEARVDDPTPDDYAEIRTAVPSRNLREHYDNLVKFTAAIRILSTQTITPFDVDRGCRFLSESFQTWARMGCHLTPYFHLSMHLKHQFFCHGPVAYVSAVWAYERHNGELLRVNHNHHTGGELEATMMRAWWKRIQVVDLINSLEALPRPHTYEDTDSIRLLKDHMQGDQKACRGTLETYLDHLRHAQDKVLLEFPHQLKHVALRYLGTSVDLSLYHLVLNHLRQKWSDVFHLIADVSYAENAVQFTGKAESFSHLFLSRRRYGTANHTRGQSARYGYINGRTPVQIEYLFKISQLDLDEQTHTANVAIVRRFVRDDNLPEVPWQLWSTDIGVKTWYADELGDYEAVAIENFSGHLVLSRTDVLGVGMWVTTPYDHEGQEADIDNE